MNSDKIYQEALDTHKSGDINQAEALYEKLLSINPYHTDGNYRLGKINFDQGKFPSALEFFRQALAKSPNNSEYQFSYLSTYLSLGNFNEFVNSFVILDNIFLKAAVYFKIKTRLFNYLQLSEKVETKDLMLLTEMVFDLGDPQEAIDLLNTNREYIVNDHPVINNFVYYLLIAGQLFEAKKLHTKVDRNLKKCKKYIFNDCLIYIREKQQDLELKRVKYLLHEFAEDDQYHSLLGVSAKILNDNNLTLYHLEQALILNPKNANALFNISLFLYNKNKKVDAFNHLKIAVQLRPLSRTLQKSFFQIAAELNSVTEATSICSKLLMVNPRDLFILEKMGELELLRRNFLQSIEYCETALSLQSKSTDVVYHLACALAGAGRHKEAISAFLKVIDLIPSKIEAYFNCGNSFYAERNYKQAIPLYEKALSFQPIVEAYNNLGNAYMELGNIDLALLNYEKALHYQPHHKNAETQIFSINTQLSKVLPSVDFTQTKNPRIIIYSAISTFICGDVNSCKYFIDQYSEMAKDFPESVKSDRDVIFCNAYYHFLQKLCQLDKNESFSPDKCFHIGDSHCLSFANREITINGHKRQIIPKITVGGKAFHFSQYSNNIAKVITKYNLLSLPSRSTVLVSFGEIDCRPNEGFIPASAKKTLDLYELVTETVKGYLEWFVTESQVLNHDLIFFTVPAPVFNGDLAQDVNMKVAKVVDIFNTNLFDRCKLRGLKIIDTYRLTCGENGFSNGVHHIDKIHIGPTILSSYTRMSNSL